MGDSYLRDGAPARAVPLLERAVALWQAHPGKPLQLADARFRLGRALADSDRRRARQLVSEARDAFAAAGTAWRTETADADKWLATHPARE
jgi:hypothetical protein